MLDKINGYKKLTIALLVMLVLVFETIFNKTLDLDVNVVSQAIFALVAAIYIIAQAIHDAAKERAKQSK
jgi:hypothetical protein